MKKSFFILTLALTLVGGNALASPVDHTDSSVSPATVVQSNVGDGLKYAYRITEISGNEVHGLPLNRESETNRGIFLYNDEIPFNVQVGDEIMVMWGEYEDEFLSIESVPVGYNFHE